MADSLQTIESTETDMVSKEIWSPEQQLEELKKRTAVIKSDMKIENLSFEPNPDDVVVAVPPKNGATWMLYICHQLRVQGKEPDFANVAHVATWIEATENLYGIKPAEKRQPVKPHIFLTHLPYPFVPLGGRRLYCFRDQNDVVISAYHFSNSLLSFKGRVSLPMFANFYVQTVVEDCLKDLLIWWEHRHDNDLMLVFYDDLKEDHAGCVRRIAKHINVDCDDDVLARVVHTTTHAEMAKHHSKFSSRKYAKIIAERVGDTLIDETKHVGQVRVDGGRSGDGQELPLEIQQSIEQLWKDIVTAKLGFKDLNEMRTALKKERSSQYI